MTKPFYKHAQVAIALSFDDHEEATILHNWIDLYEKKMKSVQGLGSKVTKEQRSIDEQMQIFKDKLGYDPAVGRPARPRGRPKDSSMPHPLPDKGTKLLSCTGETYTIEGYCRQPNVGALNLVAYRIDGQDDMIIRSIVSMFAGTLVSGEPLVTWPEDPRKLQAGEKIPMNKRRRMTRYDLMNDEHADPDTLPMSESERRRRY